MVDGVLVEHHEEKCKKLKELSSAREIDCSAFEPLVFQFEKGENYLYEGWEGFKNIENKETNNNDN